LRIDVEAAAGGGAVHPAVPPLKEDLPFATSYDSPIDLTPCFFSPVPTSPGSLETQKNDPISMDQLEQALLGFSPQTSVIRSMRNADASSRPASGPDSGGKRGTPRDARVIGNFGFKRTQKPVSPPIQERVIVIL
jgi:hypothetical protein